MPTAPHRILLAKIGLDGHDRGVKVLARSFRDAGFDVIYTGLWQTARSTMFAAMQEDVDVVGVSLLSAAHMTVMPEVLKYKADLGLDDLPVVLGGIVPEADHAKLKDMGVAAVFNPGSSLDVIIGAIRDIAAKRGRRNVAACRRGYAAGEAAALARLITHVQRDGLAGDWSPPPGRAAIVGVTGAPGVGKSSFIGKLGAALRQRGLKVAVVAVDPTSPITGGSLLGDRLRMMTADPDEHFFIRSLSAGDVAGGVGPRCAEVIALLNGFGFDVILLETVGAGQSDVAVRKLVHKTLVLLMPEAGDSVQFAKAGIMEIADAFVLNKCDLPGADATAANLRNALDDDRPIWRVSSLRNEGFDDVADGIVSLGRNQR